MAIKIKRAKTSFFTDSTTENKADKTLIDRQIGYERESKTLVVNDNGTMIRFPSDNTIYTVVIDENNSNPTTSVSYADAAAGFVPSNTIDQRPYRKGDIESCYPWNAIRPCLLKVTNGVKDITYLDPNNFGIDVDGSVVDITSGSAGDVMIEIPHFYYRFKSNGSVKHVSVSRTYQQGFSDEAFQYMTPGSRTIITTDKFYIGAYLGKYTAGQALKSISGATVSDYNQVLGVIREAAQKNGVGYEILPFNKLVALQVLYLLQFKTLNSDLAMGQTGSPSTLTTGMLNTNGMNVGSNHGTQDSTYRKIKFQGIESLWGSLGTLIEGFRTRAFNNNIQTSVGNFNDGTGYTEFGWNTSSVSYIRHINYISHIPGFIPSSTTGGSSTTYYSDIGGIPHTQGTTEVPVYGSDGAFSFGCTMNISTVNPMGGGVARLVYCL